MHVVKIDRTSLARAQNDHNDRQHFPSYLVASSTSNQIIKTMLQSNTIYEYLRTVSKIGYVREPMTGEFCFEGQIIEIRDWPRKMGAFRHPNLLGKDTFVNNNKS